MNKKDILNIILSVIEWIFYLGFLGISILFLKDVLEKFSHGKSSISVSRDEIAAQPTFSICFDFFKKMFDYGSDFNISYKLLGRGNDDQYQILKEGENSIEFLNNEKILLKRMTKCYKISSKNPTHKKSEGREIQVGKNYNN